MDIKRCFNVWTTWLWKNYACKGSFSFEKRHFCAKITIFYSIIIHFPTISAKTAKRPLLIIHLQPLSQLSDQNLFKNILEKVQEWFEMFFNLQEKIRLLSFLLMKSMLLPLVDLTQRLGVHHQMTPLISAYHRLLEGALE